MLWIIFSIVTVTVLIAVSAFFSSSEMAFVSVNKAVIIDKARNGNKKATILERLYQNYDNVISAIVIGNNLVNIFASILAGFIATLLLGEIGIGIATGIMFFLVIIFSEATPKAFGIKNEQLLLRVARPLSVITTLFYPFVVLLNGFSTGLLRLFAGREKKKMEVTEDEIMAMMRLGEEEGTIEKDEREMVDEVFEFDETIAHEVYTPKMQVEFINQNSSIKHLIEKSIKTGYSRFPVYQKNHDDIVGMVHIKDSLSIEDETIPVKKIMRKILKIDSRMKIDDVFREMKKQKTHLALLQNPKGQTLGLVSMEDLIEEIFGDISDEHDTIEPE